MDRSYEFKRTVLYWKSVLKTDLDDHNANKCNKTVDRFSELSSNIFNQLLLIDVITTPYNIRHTTTSNSKASPKGELYISKGVNVIRMIRSKREAFSIIGLQDMIHDVKVAGQLIQQLQDNVLKGIYLGKPINQHMLNYRNGVISCLQHLFQNVRNNIQEIERFRLENESYAKFVLRLMNENLTKNREIKVNLLQDNEQNYPLPADYLSFFFPRQTRTSPKHACDKTYKLEFVDKIPQKSTDRTMNLPRAVSIAKTQQNKSSESQHNKYANFMDSQELVFQHEQLVNKVQDEMQTIELNAITNVQQRLAEISSMFEKFTGTLAEQLDMFENINANVMESLNNLETTEVNLKKSNEQGLSQFQLLMCYSFAGCAFFLLFVDYIKSSDGHYLF